MSELRQQLRQVRAEYSSATYPGDLATDILRPQVSTLGRIGWAIGAIAAVAAVIVVAIKMGQPSDTNPQLAVVIDPQATDGQQQDLSGLSFSTVPTMPENVSMVPSFEDVSMPAVPSFPSFDLLVTEALENQSTSNQEQ